MANERSGRQQDRVRHEKRGLGPQAAEERKSRDHADDERKDDGFVLSKDDRESMLRQDAMQNLLPTPPERPGIHYFYASMTAPQHVTWYKRLGFVPVRSDEVEGWADAQMKTASGEYSGCITVNEMLLMKVSEKDYQRYMEIVHHERPAAEQRDAHAAIEGTKQMVERESGGLGHVEERGSGLRRFGEQREAPEKFEDAHARVKSTGINRPS